MWWNYLFRIIKQQFKKRNDVNHSTNSIYIFVTRLCFIYLYAAYHLKQPPSITSNVKFIDNLSNIGKRTRGKFNLTAPHVCLNTNRKLINIINFMFTNLS